jgi:type VI secretion system protein ImpL
VSWKLGFGLYQGPMLDSAARGAYGRMLVDAVLPRLGLRVEEQLRQPGAAQDSQYEALKAYLMLHQAEHFDAEALKAYVERDWEVQFGRALEPDQRRQLGEHLQALFDQGRAASPLPEDKALVEFNRNRLRAVSLPQRIYDRMRQEGLGSGFTAFNAVVEAGNTAELVFARKSGAPLGQGVPGLFSYRGYHEGFQKKVDSVAAQLAEEQSWVLGIAATAPKDAAAMVLANEPLVNDVRRLYLADYAAHWEAYIADVRLRPMTSLAQSMQMAQLLSAPDSPLPALMKAIARETTLMAPAKGVFGQAGQRAKGVVKEAQEQVARAIAGNQGAEAGPRLEQVMVDDRFLAIRRIATPASEGGKAPVDDTVALIAKVNAQLNAVDTAVKGGTAPPASPVANEVKTIAAQQPEPVRSMLDNLAGVSAHQGQILVRENLGKEVRSQIGEFCQQAVAGRYPLDRGSPRDATPADFALLFGPGGRIDQLFQQRLSTYVDTTARPWKFRAVEGGPLGNDSGTLPQFQRAQAIRETLFPAGGMPSLRLQFKPVEMDASLKQFILDVDGQIVRYDHGPQIPSSVQWPGPRGTSQVRVQVVPPGAGGTFGMVHEGPWALLRLFERVKVDPTNVPERFRATFDVDGRKAVFEVTASSVRNPFRLRELNDFSCPMGL